MKRVFVKVSGSESEPVEITITRDTTAGEILTALNLEGYILCTAPGPKTGIHEEKGYYKS